MSRFFIGAVMGLAVLYGALIGTRAVYTHRASEATLVSCRPGDLARAGQLFRFAEQDSWISSRGDVFRLSNCPLLRNALVARIS
jgi:hypothetical protein